METRGCAIMNTPYRLICMSFDGEYITEGRFSTVNDAWERSDDMGNRWFFYPFHFVVTEKTIINSPDRMEFCNRKRITTVEKWFAELAKVSEMEDASTDDFFFALRDIHG